MEKKNVINRALAAKKLYISPLTEVMNLSTELMQHLSSTSSGDDNFPGGPAGAPARWKEPVQRTPVF